jgi:hypothetical protein
MAAISLPLAVSTREIELIAVDYASAGASIDKHYAGSCECVASRITYAKVVEGCNPIPRDRGQRACETGALVRASVTGVAADVTVFLFRHSKHSS